MLSHDRSKWRHCWACRAIQALFHRNCRLSARFVFASLLVLPAISTAANATERLLGLPFTRVYPFEEIGDGTRPTTLTFDRAGRLTVIQEGAFVVLDDTTWLDLTDPGGDSSGVLRAMCDANGTMYYAALASWGMLTTDASAHVRPQSIVPATYPRWILSTNFTQILCMDGGIFFAGLNGLVYWDRKTKEHTFMAIDSLAYIFSVGSSVYVSSYGEGVQHLDVHHKQVESAHSAFGNKVVSNAVELDDHRLLVSTTDRLLLVCDRGTLTPWNSPVGRSISGPITSMKKLIDENIAVSIGGRGLFIVNQAGVIRMALTSPDYHRITDIAHNEPGVLWAAAESGVVKVHYGSPVTIFGQPLGLQVYWPQIVRWKDRVLIASAGRLYEPVPDAASAVTRFQLLRGQPRNGGWGIAVAGTELLIGNDDGVFALGDETRPVPVLGDIAVGRLVSVGPDLVFVVGPHEIAAIRRESGGWTECAPRVPGLGYPYIAQASPRAAWIELGANRAARLALVDGAIQARVFDHYPWSNPRWINVSPVGDITMLSAAEEGRVFFDERIGTFGAAPELEAQLAHAPFGPARIREDSRGTLWVSHAKGICTVTRSESGSTIDTHTYDVIHDPSPFVHVLPDGDAWISTGTSLYHIDRTLDLIPRRSLQPAMVSVRDRRTNAELPLDDKAPASIGALSYDQNSVDFTFFAGGYSMRRPPGYEVRINGEPWSKLGTSSVLTLSDLREGNYRLDVRLGGNPEAPGATTSFTFFVAPPWYRARLAYVAYVGLGVGVFVGLIRFFLQRSRARNLALKKTVDKRTEELRTTMAKLQQETETTATLAERNRLAGEIHDSLEQEFTGLTLQLVTTASFPNCPPEVKAGLAVAVNMVAFSRDEVRHAVRDLHSPILDSTDLVTALHHIVARIAPDSNFATITTHGPPRKLRSAIEHHLLRIAQEAITNAVKHSGASHLDISLTFHSSYAELVIADNGCGFEPRAVRAEDSRHFGLPSMRSRAGKIGASIAFVSQPGAGTRIAVHVPLTEPATK